jgi:hypothetical protein
MSPATCDRQTPYIHAYIHAAAIRSPLGDRFRVKRRDYASCGMRIPMEGAMKERGEMRC